MRLHSAERGAREEGPRGLQSLLLRNGVRLLEKPL